MKLARTVLLVIVAVLFVGWAAAPIVSELVGAYWPRDVESGVDLLVDGGVE